MGGVGEPDGSGVNDYISDHGFVDGNYSFFLMVPVGDSKFF